MLLILCFYTQVGIFKLDFSLVNIIFDDMMMMKIVILIGGERRRECISFLLDIFEEVSLIFLCNHISPLWIKESIK